MLHDDVPSVDDDDNDDNDDDDATNLWAPAISAACTLIADKLAIISSL